MKNPFEVDQHIIYAFLLIFNDIRLEAFVEAYFTIAFR